MISLYGRLLDRIHLFSCAGSNTGGNGKAEEEGPHVRRCQRAGTSQLVRKGIFLSNTDCEYFPCHPAPDGAEFNCLFCYCPLYALGKACGSDLTYLENGFKDQATASSRTSGRITAISPSTAGRSWRSFLNRIGPPIDYTKGHRTGALSCGLFMRLSNVNSRHCQRMIHVPQHRRS